MQIGSKLVVAGLVAGFIMSSGCVTSPTNPWQVFAYDSQVRFEGYALVAGDTMTVEMRNQNTGLWETIATTTAATTPTLPANVLNGNPDLYAWSVTAALAQQGVPATYCRWSPTCAEPPTPVPCEGPFPVAYARVREGAYNALTFDRSWESDWTVCFNAEINAGTPFVQAAINCASPQSPVLSFHYITIC